MTCQESPVKEFNFQVRHFSFEACLYVERWLVIRSRRKWEFIFSWNWFSLSMCTTNGKNRDRAQFYYILWVTPEALFVVLGTKPRTFCMTSKCLATELYPHNLRGGMMLWNHTKAMKTYNGQSWLPHYPPVSVSCDTVHHSCEFHEPSSNKRKHLSFSHQDPSLWCLSWFS